MSSIIFDLDLDTLFFTHQSTGIPPGLWKINTKVEGSEFRGAALKLKSSMTFSVKMVGEEIWLETGRQINNGIMI